MTYYETSKEKYYNPNISIDFIPESEVFDQRNFYDYMHKKYSISEKYFNPLNSLLKNNDIFDILGCEYEDHKNRNEIIKFEKSKLTIIVRDISSMNRKWISIISCKNPSMSNIISSSAPNSATHKDNITLIEKYVSALTDGIPNKFENKIILNRNENTGSIFSDSITKLSTKFSEFIKIKQRKNICRDYNINPVEMHWPKNIPPDYNLEEILNELRTYFIEYLSMKIKDSYKDMARVSLLKNFYFNSEISYWEDARKNNDDAIKKLPKEIEKINLEVSHENIISELANAFQLPEKKINKEIITQAEFLIWLYCCKHNIKATKNLNDFKKLLQPHYIALACSIIQGNYTHKIKIKTNIFGEPNKNIVVHKEFSRVIKKHKIDKSLKIEFNIKKLNESIKDMDTKVVAFVTAQFSLASNGDDLGSNYLRMDYIEAHARVRTERTALIAELISYLRPYRLNTAYELANNFSTILENEIVD